MLGPGVTPNLVVVVADPGTWAPNDPAKVAYQAQMRALQLQLSQGDKFCPTQTSAAVPPHRETLTRAGIVSCHPVITGTGRDAEYLPASWAHDPRLPGPARLPLLEVQTGEDGSQRSSTSSTSCGAGPAVVAAARSTYTGSKPRPPAPTRSRPGCRSRPTTPSGSSRATTAEATAMTETPA